jgi:flagellar motor switch protein FliM
VSDHVLTQEEVDALLQGINGDEAAPAADAAPGEARALDLSNREGFVRTRLAALEGIHERFARTLRASLAELLRRTPEVAISPVKVQRCAAFLRETMVPTSFNIVSLKPLRGEALLVCEPALVFAAIDAQYGGAGKYATRLEGREFSPTEQRVIARLTQTVCTEYARAWRDVFALQLEVQRTETQPQFVNIAAPADLVVTASFTLEVGETSGALHFCIPYAVLEPIRDRLASAAGASPTLLADERWLQLMRTQIQSAEVDLVAELATADATVEQLLAFKPGDFIELDLKAQIQAKVDGVPLFDAHYGTANNRYAIKIDRPIAGPQPGWLHASNPGASNHVH